MYFMFGIQTGCPRPKENLYEVAKNLIEGSLLQHGEKPTVAECIESMYPLHTEEAYMNWNGIHVPLDYKYDISDIYDEIIKMLDMITSGDRGDHFVSFADQSFKVDWEICWVSENLEIRSKWENVVGSTENFLNERNVLQFPRLDFLAEWNQLLLVLERDLKRLGLEPEGLDHLVGVRRRIAGKGLLYRE